MKNSLSRMCVCLLLMLAWVSQVNAVLTIKITKSAEGALPIAIVPFGGQGGLPIEVAEVVAADLQASGRFSPMSIGSMPERPTEFSAINFDAWRNAGMENLVIGKVIPAGDVYQIEFRLADVFKNSQVIGYQIPAHSGDLRLAGHQIADIIFEQLLGIKGAFATRIGYVTVTKRGGKRVYELQVADADGHNPHTLLTSPLPLMSPSWSPDGRSLAYVSFENRNSAIYVQNIETGQRELVASGSGINSAPAWSPDGSRLALTRSNEGNPEIYVLDLRSRHFQRITHDEGIDTEPSWSSDGNSLVFTSDRGGSPQIYRVSASGGEAQRLTHKGSYNTRASFSADGKMIVFVHRDGKGYRIATLDLTNDRMNVLTSTHLDESPSFAPNGSMIIYATVGGGGTQLAATSVDGRIKQSLGVLNGEVRSPAWGPFRK